MSLTNLEVARMEAELAGRAEHPNVKAMNTLNAVWALLHQLEGQARKETQSSSPASAPTEDAPSGSSTSSPLSFHVRAAAGAVEITGTVTFHGPSSPLALGDPLKLLSGARWTDAIPTTWARLSPYGRTPSTAPEAVQDGPPAGIGEGVWEVFYSPDVGHYVCRDAHADTPPEPCFYVKSAADALALRQQLRRAVYMPMTKPGGKDAMTEEQEVKSYNVLFMDGVEGPSIYINDTRIAGPKPWGGGQVSRSWKTTVADLQNAIPEFASLTRERDEAVREAGELRAKAAQERDALQAELSRIDTRLGKISGHWLHRDVMLDVINQRLELQSSEASGARERKEG